VNYQITMRCTIDRQAIVVTFQASAPSQHLAEHDARRLASRIGAADVQIAIAAEPPRFLLS